MTFEDLGEQLVKNIAHPVRAFRLRPVVGKSEKQISASEQIAPSEEFAEATETRSTRRLSPKHLLTAR